MYSREFDLSGVKADEIKAKYDNGVLKLTLPKKQQTIPETKRLEIE
ncbi:MAG: Hsp20 family protein [Clostridia bacterium]|nr:Hsp20 family protein [Clostridia bacterium]